MLCICHLVYCLHCNISHNKTFRSLHGGDSGMLDREVCICYLKCGGDGASKSAADHKNDKKSKKDAGSKKSAFI